MPITHHIQITDGNAVISGTNLKAKMVARMYLWEHATIEEVMAHYDLNAAQVHSAIAFYHDNREALDAEYSAQMNLLAEYGTSTDVLKAKALNKDRNQD